MQGKLLLKVIYIANIIKRQSIFSDNQEVVVNGENPVTLFNSLRHDCNY